LHDWPMTSAGRNIVDTCPGNNDGSGEQCYPEDECSADYCYRASRQPISQGTLLEDPDPSVYPLYVNGKPAGSALEAWCSVRKWITDRCMSLHIGELSMLLSILEF